MVCTFNSARLSQISEGFLGCSTGPSIWRTLKVITRSSDIFSPLLAKKRPACKQDRTRRCSNRESSNFQEGARPDKFQICFRRKGFSPLPVRFILPHTPQ